MVILYSKKSCAPCAMAKRFLAHKGIVYEEKDIENTKYQEEAYKLSGMSIVPVITDGVSVIAGYQPQKLATLVYN